MTANLASINVLAMPGGLVAWSLVWMGVLSTVGEVRARTPTASVSVAAVALPFDIPVQDLGGALNTYSRLTGLAVMIDSVYARRKGGDVRGAYTPDEALQQLLVGTGMQARHADAQSIVISPAPVAPETLSLPAPVAAVGSVDIPGVTGKPPDFLPYIARVQETLRDALCASSQTRPGSYRLVLQMRLDVRGRVERVRLLDTTGQAARDAAIAAVVKGVAVGEAPPAAMAQPVTILLVPDGPSVRTHCSLVARDYGALGPAQAPHFANAFDPRLVPRITADA